MDAPANVRIECQHTEMRPTEQVTPNPANPNKHTEKQVLKLAKIIVAHGWRHPITISKRSGFVVSGHCRLLAAQLLELEKVPIDLQEFKDEAEEWAVMIADNVVQEFAEIDGLKMADVLVMLDEANYDLELTGLDPDQIENYVVGPTDIPLGDPIPEDEFVIFHFGDHFGKVSKDVYASFVKVYDEKKKDSGEVMLDEVLRGWLGV